MFNRFVYWLKITLLVAPPIMGYWFLYLLVWVGNGSAIDMRAVLFTLGLAGVSEFAFLKWVGRWEDDD